MPALATTTAATNLEGYWSGVTVASVPPNNAPLFSIFLVNGRCAFGNALEPPGSAAGEEECATRCVGNPSCIFFSCSHLNNSETSGDDEPVNCAIFSVCNAEEASGFYTWRIYESQNMVGVACSTELTVGSIIFELSVHFCGISAGESHGQPSVLRRSAQAGSLRGVLLSAEDGGSDTADCDALDIEATACQGLQYPPGDPKSFSYWRLRILWTESSRDRRPGDLDVVLLGLDLSDGSQQWPIQLAMYPAEYGDPDPDSSFDMDNGIINSMQQLPPQKAQRLRMQPVIEAAALTSVRETESIALLASASVCNNAIFDVMKISKQSKECELAVAAIFSNSSSASYSDKYSETRISRAASTCNNSCFQYLKLAAQEAASVCSAAWQGAPLATILTGRTHSGYPVLNGSVPALGMLLSGVLNSANAVYFMDISCATNWRGGRCMPRLEESQLGCQTLTTLDSSTDLATTYLLPDGANGCDSNCSSVLADYLYSEGCCAETVAAAEVLWNKYIVRTSDLGNGFVVEWGGLIPSQLFRLPDQCPTVALNGAGTAPREAPQAVISSSAVDIACQAALCGYLPVWPSACCNGSLCANGGVQVLSTALIE